MHGPREHRDEELGRSGPVALPAPGELPSALAGRCHGVASIRPRFLRRRHSAVASAGGFAPGHSAARSVALQDLHPQQGARSHLVALDGPHAPDVDPELDAAERALLLEIYRELVGSAEGPVVPFPVELMADPAERAELAEFAAVTDLDEFRTRRQARRPADTPDPQ